MWKKIFESLRFQTIIVIILSLCMGLAGYFLSSQLFNMYIDNIYLSEKRCEERNDDYMQKFTTFVKSDNISSDNSAKLRQWCLQEKYVYLSIYKDSHLYYETDGTFGEITNSSEDTTTYNTTDMTKVSFADGVFSVDIIEFTESRLYDLENIISLIIAAVIIILSIMLFMRYVIKKVLSLSTQVRTICDDNIDHQISLKSRNELGKLSNDINEMRISIINHYQKEQSALEANNELLTSISHDIRTPLTAIIGYSEMMTDGTTTDIDEMSKYAEICKTKAYQLKDLTDALFRYFFVYGKNSTAFDIQKFKADNLLEQILIEYTTTMEMNDFCVDIKTFRSDSYIKTDVGMLKRVFDNVFSNAEKYAEKSKITSVCAEELDSCMRITVKNYIRKNKTTRESTKIGLKTCKKIMSQLNGSFRAFSDKDTFTVIVDIPKDIEQTNKI